jgi:hypothetical protein
MTCRILTVRKAEEEQAARKALDNPIWFQYTDPILLVTWRSL